jgi:hypothetical protein
MTEDDSRGLTKVSLLSTDQHSIVYRAHPTKLQSLTGGLVESILVTGIRETSLLEMGLGNLRLELSCHSLLNDEVLKPPYLELGREHR